MYQKTEVLISENVGKASFSFWHWRFDTCWIWVSFNLGSLRMIQVGRNGTCYMLQNIFHMICCEFLTFNHISKSNRNSFRFKPFCVQITFSKLWGDGNSVKRFTYTFYVLLKLISTHKNSEKILLPNRTLNLPWKPVCMHVCIYTYTILGGILIK
jgi:hypothetical protein